jgi:Tfp pilus assembly protein PilO
MMKLSLLASPRIRKAVRTMTNRLWLLGSVLVVGVVVVLGWFLGIAPKLEEAALARTDLAAVEAQNRAQEEALMLLRDQFDNIDELRADLVDLQRNIPDVLGDQNLSDSISALAAANGVTISSIFFTEAQVFGDSSTDSEDEPAAVAPEGVYMVPVTVTVTGEAVAVVRFASALQQRDHVFFAEKLVVEPGSGTVSGFIFVVRPPGVDLSKFDSDDVDATQEPTPTPTDTPAPTPDPTETPSP